MTQRDIYFELFPTPTQWNLLKDLVLMLTATRGTGFQNLKQEFIACHSEQFQLMKTNCVLHGQQRMANLKTRKVIGKFVKFQKSRLKTSQLIMMEKSLGQSQDLHQQTFQRTKHTSFGEKVKRPILTLQFLNQNIRQMKTFWELRLERFHMAKTNLTTLLLCSAKSKMLRNLNLQKI